MSNNKFALHVILLSTQKELTLSTLKTNLLHIHRSHYTIYYYNYNPCCNFPYPWIKWYSSVSSSCCITFRSSCSSISFATPEIMSKVYSYHYLELLVIGINMNVLKLRLKFKNWSNFHKN